MNIEAVKDLLYKMADDQLVLGHRNSEWTGLGPMLEEDIAFSSMAQDKIGQSLALYKQLNELGESDPDILAFMRNQEQFHNCQFVELPIGEFDFSLIRHFLFDTAEYCRFEMLSNSTYEPLSQMARKFRGEVKYHIMHANSFIHQLGNGTEESISRLQRSLEYAIPFALGIFEASKLEEDLIKDGVFRGERILRDEWEAKITEILNDTKLQLPQLSEQVPQNGGRYGSHTEYLQPMLDEMSEVFNVDPSADW